MTPRERLEQLEAKIAQENTKYETIQQRLRMMGLLVGGEVIESGRNIVMFKCDDRIYFLRDDGEG